jgi:hypothetical protein
MCGPNMGQIIAPGQSVHEMPQNAALRAANPELAFPLGGVPGQPGFDLAQRFAGTKLGSTKVDDSKSASSVGTVLGSTK